MKQFHLVFLCVSNLGRSPFAELFFRKMIDDLNHGLADRVNVMSAGFIPQAIKDHAARLQIGFPEPFYG